MRTIRHQNIIRGISSTSSQYLPRPFIKEVTGGRIQTNTTKNLTIRGFNFIEESAVEIFPKTVALENLTFVDPSTIEITVKADDNEGSFDVVISNGNLDSGSSGKEVLVVKASIWVDLRSTSLKDLNLASSNDVTVNQNANKGLWAAGSGNAWNRGVLFPDFSWKRDDEVDFSFVFTVSGNGYAMFGIGNDGIDVNNLSNQSYYKSEIELYLNQSRTNQVYGGGGSQNWNQNIGNSVNFATDKFYKVIFTKSGTKDAKCYLTEVAGDNFDTDVSVLQEWVSNCPATSKTLMPFWSAVSNANLFLTGFRVG